MTAHRYSIEYLVHYQCARCHGWWTIGDGPTTGHVYCPWCGVLHTLVTIDDAEAAERKRAWTQMTGGE